MRFHSCAAALILLALSAASVVSAPATAAPGPLRPPPRPNPAADITQANDFTFATYDQIRRAGGDVFFSGTSLRDALGIAYLGAKDGTASEMATALHLDPDRTNAMAFAKAELAAWQAAKGNSDLTVANRLWADKTFAMLPPYTSNVQSANAGSSESRSVAINCAVGFSGTPGNGPNPVNATRINGPRRPSRTRSGP